MQKEILNLVAKNLAELDTMAEGEYPPSGRNIKDMANIAGTIIHLMEAYQDNLSVTPITGCEIKHWKKLKNS